MRRRYRLLAAASLLAPACSHSAAWRGRSDRSASPTQAGQAGPDATVARPSATTSTGPAPSSAGAAVIERAPADSTTTVVTINGLPTTMPATTSTTFAVAHAALPENQPGLALASWYGAESGALTANGDVYDPDGLTFAHLTLPFGTRVTFCGPLGCVTATCTDRGPVASTGRTFDLSRAAFARVAPLRQGVAEVSWEVAG